MGILAVKCRSCGGSIPVFRNVPQGVEIVGGTSEGVRVTVKCPHCHIPGSYAFAEAAYQAEEATPAVAS